MKIIISPTKQMVAETDSFLAESKPLYIKEASQILNSLQALSYGEAKQLWKCNDKLATENFERLKNMQLDKQLSPAVMSYKGLQFQYMVPDLFTESELSYVKENLRILSGFYGILRPFDGISPYRLEMKATLPIQSHNNLYQFWGQKIYDALAFDEGPVINLASKEYTKALTPYLKTSDQLIDIVFAHLIDGKLKIKATPAKMARGQMVRFAAEHQAVQIDDLKHFEHPHYIFSKEHSTDHQFVFLNQT